MKRANGQRGWLLVGLIVLLSAVIVALVGVTFFLTEHLRSVGLHQGQARAIYLAQAGAMRSFYDFRSGTGVVLGEQPVVAGPAAGTADDDVYQIVSGPAADFLLVNMRGSIGFPNANICGSSREAISGWSMRNVLANTAGSFPLTIDKIRVDWATPGERVLRIDLDGTGADWIAPGCGAGCTVATCVGELAGTEINLVPTVPSANRTIQPDSLFSPNRIWFSTTINQEVWIDLTLFLSDGSTTRAHYHRLDNTRSTADFHVLVDGIARRAPFPFPIRRRLRATYRMSTALLSAPGWVMGYQEP